MNEQLEYLRHVADDEFTYRFPSGWMMTEEDDEKGDRVIFHLQERKTGGQYGSVSLAKWLLERSPEEIKWATMVEFREIRQLFDDPKRQKRDQERLRNQARNDAAFRRAKEYR